MTAAGSPGTAGLFGPWSESGFGSGGETMQFGVDPSRPNEPHSVTTAKRGILERIVRRGPT